MDQASVDELKETFEHMGEPQVRRRVALADFSPERMKVALEWLDEQEDARAGRHNQPTLAWAKSAAIAGWIGVGLALLALVVALLK